jgi:hypothetical protein
MVVRGKVLIRSSNATADERVFRDVYLAVHFSNKALHLFKQHALLKRLMRRDGRRAKEKTLRVPAHTYTRRKRTESIKEGEKTDGIRKESELF